VYTHVGEDAQIFRGLEMTKISAEDPNVPRKMRERYEAITRITDEFCHEHLNEKYADLSRKMAATLSRKRLSPLESGRLRSWAAGIVYALGRVNFLSDDSREPHMTISELCEKIGVSQGNASSKSRDMEPAWPHSDGPGLVSAEHAGGETAGMDRRGEWSARGCAHVA
jgi:hypothetical protein